MLHGDSGASGGKENSGGSGGVRWAFLIKKGDVEVVKWGGGREGGGG